MGGAGISRKIAALRAAALAGTLAWFLVVPLCPGPLAALMPSGGAAGFMCCFMLGCALACLWSLLRRPSSQGKGRRLSCLALPVGTALAAGCGIAGVAHPLAWSCTAGLIAGVGECFAMLAWARQLARQPLRETARCCARAGLGAVVVGILFQTTASCLPALAALLFACALLGSLEGVLPRACNGQSPAAETNATAAPGITNPVARGRSATSGTGLRKPETPAQADVPPSHGLRANVKRLASLFLDLWEPALGLGLSLLSALLPWGSLVFGSEASMPPYWSFALGIAATVLALLVYADRTRQHLDFNIAAHIAVPVLAASVVGLRMLGDLEEIGVELTFLKGVGSGLAGAGFLLLALLSMARVAHDEDAPEEPFALGFALACLIGFITLPMHMAHQQFASLVAPFLSLAFLVASCCSSVVHIRRHVGAQEPHALSIEQAVERICQEHGLSPRERQVVGHLVLGRSADSIGMKLGISPNTVRSHIVNIHTKLSISSRDELADLIEQTMQKNTR